jgi:hypothetical protein
MELLKKAVNLVRIREHGFLLHLQKSRTKVKPVQEIAAICVSCPGRCKAEKGLKVCGRQTREKAKRDAHSL